ncbi:MAG: extracellular solute-binding protein [Lachnospiraceae bacterium]|nr:extracellular solute-binding protein [Lachnospiraceae bacterium]
MRKKILFFTLILLLLCGCMGTSFEEEPVSEENRLIIYTSHKEEIYKPIIREFEERSGIFVDVAEGGTNQLLNRIAEESGGEGADIMFGGGADSLIAYEDCFEPYVTAQSARLDPTYASPSDSYTVFSKLPVVFVYNTKRVLKEEAPKSWAELLKDEWKGEIAFTDPEKSGSAYTALSILVQVTDKENCGNAIKRFSELLDGTLSEGSNTIVEDVARGDKMVGIVLEESALKKMASGAELEMVYPSDRTCAVPDGCAMIRGARHRENAEKFMEFIVGDDVQRLLGEQLFRHSVRTDFESSNVPHEALYDIEFSNTKREELLRLWDACMGGR